MKKLLVLFSLLLLPLNAYAWISESGSGVVSDNAVISRASLEATQVLTSDLQSNLYGNTILGGTVNYASFNTGGVFSTRNVTNSVDTVMLGNNQYIAWLGTGNADYTQRRIGLSLDNVFTIGYATNIQGRVSADGVNATSINTTRMLVSGGVTLTSVYGTGTCSFTFNNGLLTGATC